MILGGNFATSNTNFNLLERWKSVDYTHYLY